MLNIERYIKEIENEFLYGVKAGKTSVVSFEEAIQKVHSNHSNAYSRYGTYGWLFEDDSESKENVNHPNHYQGAHECIDVMVAMFGKEAVRHFAMCNAFKYRYRAMLKNGAEDIKKAEWYEDWLINNA